jgi:hypothetical protein
MYVIVHHQIKSAEVAFERGEKLMRGDDAPAGVRVLQFYPSADASTVICLWESDSVDAVQGYVETTLGDSSVNTSYEVDAKQAFSERPLGLPAAPAIAA